MEEEPKCETYRFGYSGLAGSLLSLSHRHTLPHRPAFVFCLFSCIKLIPPCSDIALNTQQAHEDYVGIICTKAVHRFDLVPFPSLTPN